MTNREWLNSLSNKELAEKLLPPHCECEYCIINAECNHIYGNCYGEIAEWLNKKHIEPMPEIKIGDVLYSYIDETRASFVVMSDTYASNLHGIIVRWREINDIWKIERMNDEKGMQEVIWRADDE